MGGYTELFYMGWEDWDISQSSFNKSSISFWVAMIFISKYITNTTQLSIKKAKKERLSIIMRMKISLFMFFYNLSLMANDIRQLKSTTILKALKTVFKCNKNYGDIFCRYFLKYFIHDRVYGLP